MTMTTLTVNKMMTSPTVNFPVMLTGKEYKMVLLQCHLSGTHDGISAIPGIDGSWYMDQVDPQKELPTRNNNRPYHRLFYPDLPTCEGNQHVKNLINSAEKRCKGIVGEAVTKLDCYYHMTVINGNNKLILRCNPV